MSKTGVADAKEILTLDGLADILRKNCGGFNENYYETIRANVSCLPDNATLLTKYLCVRFHLEYDRVISCLTPSSPSIEIYGIANYDGRALPNDLILSEVAKRLSKKHEVEFDGINFHQYVLPGDNVDKAKAKIRGVESAQKTLNNIVEKKVNELLLSTV